MKVLMFYELIAGFQRFLVGTADTTERIHILTEGVHTMEFRFQLPESDDIATSFEGR